jgi:hypothetical protein
MALCLENSFNLTGKHTNYGIDYLLEEEVFSHAIQLIFA